VLTLSLKCAEPPDASCQSRIADQIKSDRYVWGTFQKKGANVHCNRPMAGYYLLGAAAAAGVTAGLAGGNPDVSTVTVRPPVSITPTSVSGAQ